MTPARVLSAVIAVLLILAQAARAQDSAPSSRPSESHRIAVKVTGDGAVIAESNETVGSIDGVRTLVSRVGEKVEKAFDEVIDGRSSYSVSVLIDVGAGLPLPWLEAAIFDILNHVTFVEVGQDFFFRSEVGIVMSIDGALNRCPVLPFKTVGLVKRPDGRGLEREVLLGLEVPEGPNDRDLAHVLLGRAGAEASADWWRWSSIGPGPAAESRATPTLSETAPLATARDVGVALTKARQHGAGAISQGRRQPLSVSRVGEVRGLEVLVPECGAVAGRRGHVVTAAGSSYIGTIEVSGLPGVERPKHVACKVIAIDLEAGQRPFAAGQLVIFEPE
jgi:hypothetical protein